MICYLGTGQTRRHDRTLTIDLPGAVIHARTFSSDDPAKLGWDRWRVGMADEGLVTLRGVDVQTAATAQKELSSFEPIAKVLISRCARSQHEKCGVSKNRCAVVQQEKRPLVRPAAKIEAATHRLRTKLPWVR